MNQLTITIKRLFVFYAFATIFGLGTAYAIPNLTKSFSADTIGVDGVSTLTFTLSNAEDANGYTGISFDDNLPSGVVVASPANVSSTCSDAIVDASDGSALIAVSVARLAGNESCTIAVNVTSDTVGSYTNTTSILTYDGGTTATASANLNVTLDLPTFTKSFSPSTITLGQISRLTFNISQDAGAASAIGAFQFSDALPSGMRVAPFPNIVSSCPSSMFDPTVTAAAGTSSISVIQNGFLPSYPALSAGETCTISVDVVAVGNGKWGNITELTINNTTVSGKASAVLTVAQNPLTKRFINNPVSPGDTTNLEFTLTNLDRTNSVSNISFTDDLTILSGLTATGLPKSVCGGTLSGTTNLSFSGGTLGVEETCSFSVALDVPVNATPGAYINTTSNVSATVGGSATVWSPATDILVVATMPLLSKEFLDSPVLAGSTVSLEFNITNPSTTEAMSDIAFTDELTTFLPFPVTATLPPAPCGVGSSISLISTTGDNHLLSFSGGSLASDSTCSFQVDINVPITLGSGSYVNVTSPITANLPGGPTAGYLATDTLDVISAPRLSKSFVGNAVPDNNITLEFSLSHHPNSPAAATNISFSDNLNAVLAGLISVTPPQSDICGVGSSLSGDTNVSFTGGSLAPGETCDFNITVYVPASATFGTFTNTVDDVMAQVGGQSVSGSSANAALTVVGLKFSKKFLENPSYAGDDVTLQFSIDNVSSVDATGITFTDSLSDVLAGLNATVLPANDFCGAGSTISGTTTLNMTGGTLTAGSSCDFNVTVNVPLSTTQGNYKNTTTTLSATLGGTGVSISPAIDTLIINEPLVVSKEFDKAVVMPSDTVTMRITLVNEHPTKSMTALAFTDDLDAALSGLVATSFPVNTCGGTLSGTNLVSLSGGTIAADSNCTIEALLQIPAVVIGSTLNNTTSTVTADLNGNAISALGASASLYINNLLLEKSFATSSVLAGATTTLNFHIENIGSSSSNGLAFSDDLTAMLSGLSAVGLPKNDVCGSGSTVSGTSFITLTGATLAAGSSCDFSVDVLVPNTAVSGTYSNTTSNLSSNGLTVAVPATADLDIVEVPTFSKSFAPATLALNEISTLTFTIDNSSNAFNTASLAFSDTFPTGLIVATPSNAATTCAGGTLTAVSGSGSVSYSGGTVASGLTCNVSVDVMSNASGTYVNTSSVLSTSFGNGTTATDTLSVIGLSIPGFSKSFSPSSIAKDATSTLMFTIDNSANAFAVGALSFDDSFPSGITIASPANASNTCTGGTLTAVAGTTVISYSAGEVAANSVCNISVDVVGSTIGSLENNSSTLSTDVGVSAHGANATLDVSDIDNLPDVIEQGPDGTDTGYDGDNSGTPDRFESNVYSLHVNAGTSYITLKTEQDYNPANTLVEDGNPIPPDAPDGVVFPVGFLNIDVPTDGNGHAVVEIYLPNGVTANSYWKYTATVANPTPHWYEFLYDGTTGAIIEGNKITLHFQDGERGDNDISVNGQIDDQGGPGFRAVVAVPLFGPFGYLLLASLFGLFGVRRLKD